MGKIVHLYPRSEDLPSNLITSKPFEFRKADWETTDFVQMSRCQSVKMEQHREEILRRGGKGIWNLPPHYSLKGSMAHTIRAVYTYREKEEQMKRVYYLIGLMDCMINQVNPILRTDLLRDMYKKVLTMKDEFGIHWYGRLDRVLLPIDSRFYNESEYRSRLNKAQSMKELYRAIRKGTDEMFDILSLKYVFYCPGMRG